MFFTGALTLCGVAGWLGSRSSHYSSNSVQSSYTDAALNALAASSTEITLDAWLPLASNAKGVPFVTTPYPSDPRENTLYVYDALSKASRVADKNIRQFGGLIHCGSQDPLASPDLRYTVYVDHNNAVTLLSNETLAKRVLYHPPSSSAALYLLAWSPNSKRVMFCQHGADGEYGPPEPVPTSYFVFDLTTGRLKALPTGTTQIEFSDFIDNDNLTTYVTPANPGKPDDTDRTALNITSLTRNQSLYDRIVAPTVDPTAFDPQRSYSDGHAKTAFSIAQLGSDNFENPPAGLEKGGVSTIEIFDVAQRTTQTVKKGAFAQYQWPIISPDGSKVVYDERGLDSPNTTPNHLWMYDVATNTHSIYFEGSAQAVQWIDNDSLFFISYDAEGGAHHHVLTLSTRHIADIP